MSKKQNNTPDEHKKDAGTPMGPDAINTPNSTDTPASVESGVLGSKSTITQNANQNPITVSGNQIKGNTPGGNVNEQRTANTNKPRNNPQGNWPMSVDKSQKGPGRKAD
ncbi:hypothetical protein [Hymenobacter saemangeumensis]